MLEFSSLLKSYRVLGLLHHATIEDIQKAHGQIHHLKASEHPFGLDFSLLSHTEKVELIEGAYQFISDNFEAIQSFWAQLREPTYAVVSGSRTHATYQDMQSYSQNKA